MIKTTLIFAGLVLVIIAGCSNLKEPVSTNQERGIAVHPSGWLQKSSSDFHGVFIRADGWDMENCKSCHGVDYAGGISESSCLGCHMDTPEDCNVCHGGIDNTSAAPPRDIDDNISTETIGVGAHTTHLEGNLLSDGLECVECHMVPESLYAPGHVDDDLPAEVTFSGLAFTDGAQPAWNHSTAGCSNVYCHGNWSLSKENSLFPWAYAGETIGGNNATVTWTGANQAACGSCHALPPSGHLQFALNECANCHVGVVNSQGEIIDKTKHINGMANFLENEYPIF
jgi:predicted CxxxxCH...CXXCH cytochrome family protein